MNLGHGNISKYEKEDRGLTPEMICQLCDLFEVSADYLLCRSNMDNAQLSVEDEELLNRYHKAEPNIQAAIDLMLEPYGKKENATNAS